MDTSTPTFNNVCCVEVIPSRPSAGDFSIICFGLELLKTKDCVNIALLVLVIERSPDQLPWFSMKALNGFNGMA